MRLPCRSKRSFFSWKSVKPFKLKVDLKKIMWLQATVKKILDYMLMRKRTSIDT